MAYDEKLAERIRKALAGLPIEEKKMFGHLAFMVNGKMCLNAGSESMMCRIDPDLHEREVKRDGCHTVVMKGREYKGYIRVDKKNIKTEKNFGHWVRLALDFNKKLVAKSKS